MTRAITVFTDLDDTLFQTEAKTRALTGRHGGSGAAALTRRPMTGPARRSPFTPRPSLPCWTCCSVARSFP